MMQGLHNFTNNCSILNSVGQDVQDVFDGFGVNIEANGTTTTFVCYGCSTTNLNRRSKLQLNYDPILVLGNAPRKQQQRSIGQLVTELKTLADGEPCDSGEKKDSFIFHSWLSSIARVSNCKRKRSWCKDLRTWSGKLSCSDWRKGGAKCRDLDGWRAPSSALSAKEGHIRHPQGRNENFEGTASTAGNQDIVPGIARTSKIGEKKGNVNKINLVLLVVPIVVNQNQGRSRSANLAGTPGILRWKGLLWRQAKIAWRIVDMPTRVQRSIRAVISASLTTSSSCSIGLGLEWHLYVVKAWKKGIFVRIPCCERASQQHDSKMSCLTQYFVGTCFPPRLQRGLARGQCQGCFPG